MTSDDAIEAAIDAHYQQIRKSGMFTILDGWHGYHCVLTPDPGPFPSAKDLARWREPKEAWRAQIKRTGRPRTKPPKVKAVKSTICRLCPRPRDTHRTVCQPCFNAARRKAAFASGE
jgi:hypothetical protein